MVPTKAYLRAPFIGAAPAVYAASRLVRPVYVVRPTLLLDTFSVLVPPGALAVALGGLFIFLVAWLTEVFLYRFVLRLPWGTSFLESLRSYSPLVFLWVYGLLFFPGLPGFPMVGWWLLLDGSRWLLTLIVGVVVYRKVSFVRAQWSATPWRRGAAVTSGATVLFGAALFSTLFAMTPSRRFTEPYDSRWGTGDEPRYVRIAASLLYDGDADIANAEEHVGHKPEPFRFLAHVLTWPAATVSAIGDVASSLWSVSGEQPSGLGGQVIRGKDGGTYYVYLPGFPLLLTPAMTLDGFFFPGRLPMVILTCLVVGVLTAIAIARLVQPYVGGRLESYVMMAALSLTLPMFFYAFQIYPEMTAALCLAAMLVTLLKENLHRRQALLFGLAASLLPWLHTRYYPVLGVCVLALIYRARRDHLRLEVAAWALVLPSISVALQCLYIFHITGSLLPDSLWVLNGYPRGGHLLNPGAFKGLYYLLLGREEGLLVYAPLYVLAVLGMRELWRQSRFAVFLSLAVFIPYLWISASHDQGGSGGWSPATRYLVPVTPVLALWLAAWLGRKDNRPLRWGTFFVASAASFWIAQGMLVERNFPYDRTAYLSSGVIDVSPVLGSVQEPDPWSTRTVYPALLVLLLALVDIGLRRGQALSLGGVALAGVGIVLVTGAISQTWIAREPWLSTRPVAGEVRLRADRASLVALPICREGRPGLRFKGAAGPHDLTVTGQNFERHVVVPPTGTTDMDVEVSPYRRITRDGTESIAVVRLRLGRGQTPLYVATRCR